MSTTLLTKHSLRTFIVLCSILLTCTKSYSQDTNIVIADTVSLSTDSIANDSIPDPRKELSPDAIKDKIDYKAIDSIRFNISEKKVYLYRGVEIFYQTIILKADYVEIDFNDNTLYATGITDSAGHETGRPVFQEGDQSFTARTILYNFDSKKGIIRDIMTNEGESYIHGDLVKRFPNEVTNIKNGMYTTCSDENPHYDIRFFKAKVIPNDKIVTGPAYLEVEHVPTPLIIPFGFFPNKKGQLSGILMPSYGESASMGFYFKDGGYYWGISDYIDLAVRGDIYTRGSWGAKIQSNYKKRYKYSGGISINYAVNLLGEKNTESFQKNKQFFVKWQHTQDPKARPNSSFSANVNAGSSKYNKYNSTNTGDYLSNDFESSIAYQKSFGQGKYNLGVNLGYRQNTGTHEVILTAPTVNFNVNTMYPFRKKKKVGELKWYDNISFNYSVSGQNQLNTIDSLIWSMQSFKRMQNGIQHSIPIKSTIKVLKYFSWTNSLNLSEKWYFDSKRKSWFVDADTAYVQTDTLRGFYPVHEISAATGLTTRIYGMYQFKKGAIKAIRHVLTPTVNFTYRPDFGTKFWGYYGYSQSDTLGTQTKYPYYQGNIYGYPADGQSGRVGLSLANNLEMKVRSRKDTITGTKKVILIENLTISCGYDIARDSLNWDNLLISGRTKLFKRLDLTYISSWDPYYYDTAGVKMNASEWKMNKRLFRQARSQWNIGLQWSISSNDLKKKNKDKKESNTTSTYTPTGPVDYDNPWSLNLSYNLTYANTFNPTLYAYVKDTIQTLQISADIAITPKWKFGFTTGYDFKAKELSYTDINFYRDLHCWEMVLKWIPFGPRKSYNLTIRVKSTILQDLKLEKKTDWMDNY